ncbi:ATP-binding protein [Streptomyces sp. Q6]|uniref:ATP-binding protein n=1 Tax=Streptomyces citrinus TaxID=3118173 RepID=A0ACD5AKQ0_9ACTN
MSDPRVVPLPLGAKWSDLSTPLHEPESIRIKTYLQGIADDDLITLQWPSTIVGSFDEGEVVERMVIVSQDGGRWLRQAAHGMQPEALLDHVASIYLCASRTVQGIELRYVFVDLDDSGPFLVCRRDDFKAVYTALNSRGKDVGRVWKGARLLDADLWRQVDPDSYVFADGLMEKVKANTSGFLQGETANLLLEWGVPPKRGVLLHGSPGNGKTILSRLAVRHAVETGINAVFLDVANLWDWTEIGDHLRMAASRSPVLIVLDDLDIYCGLRATDNQNSQEMRQRFLADLLEFLDGMEPTQGYVLLATANHIENLDSALLRSGRLGVHIPVHGPDKTQREELLRQALEGPGGVKPPRLAKGAALLEGCSYADIAECAKRYKQAVVNVHQRITSDQRLFDETAEEFAKSMAADRAKRLPAPDADEKPDEEKA